MIIGRALYTDALKSAALLRLTLQDDDIDVVQGMKNILKSHTSLKKLTTQDVMEWPVTSVVLSEDNDSKDLSCTIIKTIQSKLALIKPWLI